MYTKIDVNKEDIKEILDLFKKDAGDDNYVHFNESFVSTKIYLDSYDESNLYFYLFNNEVVIQNISIKNKRQGIATKLIKLCAELGKRKGVSSLRIQSVLTNEMLMLCKKLNFKQDTNNLLNSEYGDYTISINSLLST